MNIDEIGVALMDALNEDGWSVTVETDYSLDHKHYNAFKAQNAPLKAFSRLDIVMFALPY